MFDIAGGQLDPLSPLVKGVVKEGLRSNEFKKCPLFLNKLDLLNVCNITVSRVLLCPHKLCIVGSSCK